MNIVIKLNTQKTLHFICLVIGNFLTCMKEFATGRANVIFRCSLSAFSSECR